MNYLTSVFAALIIGSFCVVGAIGTCEAFPSEAGMLPQSLQKLMANPVLQVKKKKNKCIKVFECDYFAPATACSTPPCCKKGHWEKNCDVNTGQAPATNKETPKETPKDEPSKQYCEGYGSMNGVDYFKANCQGQHSGKYDCQVDSLNPTTHYHCCCYY